MRSKRLGGIHGTTSLIALGCLLGAATVAATTHVSAAASAAPANCSYLHQNVGGVPASGWWGNSARIYVNTSDVINSLHNSIYRSVFVWQDINNFVEVGWGAGPNNITGHSTPTAYAYWRIAGTPGDKISSSLTENTDHGFAVENVGHVSIFRFLLDASLFAYSPQMNFDAANTPSNSESYNTCDSMYTHEYELSYFHSDGTWSADWGNWGCFTNTSLAWYLHKNSASDLTVTQSSRGALC